jgi:hypothetical protein
MSKQQQTSKGIKLAWLVFGILFLSSLIYATTITDTSITTSNFAGSSAFSTNDAYLKFSGVNSLLGSPTVGTGGILFNQTVPGAKGGIWWDAYDANSGKVRTAAWLVAHYNSSANGGAHSHFSIEVLNNFTSSTPSVDTVFAVAYGSNMKQSQVTVYNADFVVNNRLVVNSTSNFKASPATTFDVYPNNQSTYALRIANTSAITFAALGTGDISFAGDNVTITQLAGSGDAFACLDSNGKLFRKATACA